MRRVVVTVGLLLFLLGVLLLNEGSMVVSPLAESLRLTSHVRVESVLVAPTLLTVPAVNHTSVHVNVNDGAQVAGFFRVGGGRDVDFFVMDERGFREWRVSGRASVLLAVFSANVYNFTLALGSGQAYYFVFENQDSGRCTVLFGLYSVSERVVVNPVVEYLPFGLVGLGVLLIVWGAVSGKAKKKPIMDEEKVTEAAEPVEGWVCRFCSTQNGLEKGFCQNCGRSRR